MTVLLANGEALDADLLVGADGINSKIRHQLLGPELRDAFAATSCSYVLPRDAVHRRAPRRVIVVMA